MEQELLLRLGERLRRAPANLMSRAAWVERAVQRLAVDLARRQVRERRRRSSCVSLETPLRVGSNAGGQTLAAVTSEERLRAHRGVGRMSTERRSDLSIDVADILELLPAELHMTAELVLTHGRETAAAMLGISRSTISDRERKMRMCFEDKELEDFL